jgi:flagellar basal-body rod protein FlgB
MFVERLLNQGNAPIIEQALKFSAARHRLILDNVANISTPGYVQKDLSVGRFNQLLQERVELRRKAAPGSVRFDDIAGELENPARGVLFHDRSNRSTEQLMTDAAKNALYHNMLVELLRKAHGSIENALKERVG